MKPSILSVASAAVFLYSCAQPASSPIGAADPSAPTSQTVDLSTDSDPAQAALDAELTAYKRAEPVFTSRCGPCHSSDGASAAAAHFSVDEYPFPSMHADDLGETIKRVVGATSTAATMPKDAPGSFTDTELKAIVEWADAYAASHAAGAGHHKDHGAHGHGQHGGHQ